jgi:NADH-quinone oxidoreductase subunit J
MGDPILFLVLAAVAVLSAFGMLRSRNAVHSALYLILNFGTVAVLYLILNAPFIAMVQVTVYAGAIMVLFLFVIMLLGAERLGGRRIVTVHGISALILVLALAGVLVFLLASGNGPAGQAAAEGIDAGPQAVGLTLFESYVFPFEVTSILLLAAMVGVVALRTHLRSRKEDARSNR